MVALFSTGHTVRSFYKAVSSAGISIKTVDCVLTIFQHGKTHFKTWINIIGVQIWTFSGSVQLFRSAKPGK